MSDTQTDLVVQISASGLDSDMTAATAKSGDDCRLITELRRCLQPGAEIALVFEGYMAITSILWLSDARPDGSVRAGVRLLGVSALPRKLQETKSNWHSLSRRGDPESLDSAVVSQYF